VNDVIRAAAATAIQTSDYVVDETVYVVYKHCYRFKSVAIRFRRRLIVFCMISVTIGAEHKVRQAYYVGVSLMLGCYVARTTGHGVADVVQCTPGLPAVQPHPNVVD